MSMEIFNDLTQRVRPDIAKTMQAVAQPCWDTSFVEVIRGIMDDDALRTLNQLHGEDRFRMNRENGMSAIVDLTQGKRGKIWALR